MHANNSLLSIQLNWLKELRHLHELYDEIYKPLFLHLLTMEVGDKEADVITLHKFSPQDLKCFGPH